MLTKTKWVNLRCTVDVDRCAKSNNYIIEGNWLGSSQDAREMGMILQNSWIFFM